MHVSHFVASAVRWEFDDKLTEIQLKFTYTFELILRMLSLKYF